MRSILPYLLLGCFISGCSHKNKNREIDAYFETEIMNRIGVVRAQPDSMHLDALKINRAVNNLVLLSRDTENRRAVIDQANRYFKTLAGENNINPADLGQLSLDMEPDHISSLIKETELNFFNQVIFKMKPATEHNIYTAH